MGLMFLLQIHVQLHVEAGHSAYRCSLDAPWRLHCENSHNKPLIYSERNYMSRIVTDWIFTYEFRPIMEWVLNCASLTHPLGTRPVSSMINDERHCNL